MPDTKRWGMTIPFGGVPLAEQRDRYAELQDLGYTIAAYPLTLLSASIKAMKASLALLAECRPTDDLLMPWPELRAEVGFDEYYKMEERYK